MGTNSTRSRTKIARRRLLCRSLALLGGAVLMGAVAAGCGGDETADSTAAAGKTVLHVSGSGSTTALLKKLTSARLPGSAEADLVYLEGTNSGGGIAAVNAGAIEIGAVSRPPKPGELGADVQYRAFATDAAAFVARGGGVSSLTRRQLTRAFAGETKNWRQLGGRDLPIIVLVRDEDESLTQILRRDLFGEKFRFSRHATVLFSTGDMNKALEKTPGALGFTSFGSIVSDAQGLSPIAVDGKRPSVAALERADYPFTRKLGIVFRASTDTSAFTSYLGSRASRTRLRVLGYAPSS